MNKVFAGLLVFSFLLAGKNVCAQNHSSSDSLRLAFDLWDGYSRGGKYISMEEAAFLFDNNPEAKRAYKKGKFGSKIGIAFFALSGLVLGASVEEIARTEHFSLHGLWFGGILGGTGFLFVRKADSNFSKAANIYNLPLK